MSLLFDEIVKTVDRSTAPALESLIRHEVGGIAVNGDFDIEEDPMVAMAMEALGKDVQYDATNDPEAAEFTDEEIEKLAAEGAKDEDEDDGYAEETIGDLLDGFVQAVYGDPLDEDPTDVLSDEDLEDIDDDFEEGMEGRSITGQAEESSIVSSVDIVDTMINAIESYLESPADDVDSIHSMYADLLDTKVALEAMSAEDEATIEKEIKILEKWIHIYGGQAVETPSKFLEREIRSLKSRIENLKAQLATAAAGATA